MKSMDISRRKTIRKVLFVLGIIIIWEVLALSGIYPKLLFPDLISIGKALVNGIQNGEIFSRTIYSLYLIGTGMLIGTLLALILTALSMLSKTFATFVELLVSIMHPLPGIALLPVILLWFGTGAKSIIFVIIHSVLWPLVLNTYNGFRSVSRTQLEVGKNLGLKGARLVAQIMIPSAFPSILTGLKISWARSWRALVAAEMIFGASGSEGGLGWLIYQKRYFLDIPSVFAALIVIVMIGILVEGFLFNRVERKTVERWGMVSVRG